MSLSPTYSGTIYARRPVSVLLAFFDKNSGTVRKGANFVALYNAGNYCVEWERLYRSSVVWLLVQKPIPVYGLFPTARFISVRTLCSQTLFSEAIFEPFKGSYPQLESWIFFVYLNAHQELIRRRIYPRARDVQSNRWKFNLRHCNGMDFFPVLFL